MYLRNTIFVAASNSSIMQFKRTDEKKMVSLKFGANFFLYLCIVNSCFRPARISLIHQKYKTGLREEDRNTSTTDTVSVTIPAFERVIKSTGTATVNGMKHTENSNKIYIIVATDLLYFSRFIAFWPNLWVDTSLALICCWWCRMIL